MSQVADIRIGSLKIPHLAVQVERRNTPALVDRPLILGTRDVADYSPDLYALGIRRGMPLRRARVLSAEARIRPLDSAAYLHAFEEVLGILDEWAPVVEDAGPGRAYLDLQYGESHHGWASEVIRVIQANTGLCVSLGIATCKFVAHVASASATNERVLSVEGTGADFLRPYPISILPLDDDAQRRLKLLGLYTVGAYADLPSPSILNAFGVDGQYAHALARGIDERRVIPRLKNRTESVQQSFDPALEDHMTLSAVVNRLLRVLSERLNHKGQMCRALRADFSDAAGRREGANWKLHEPTSQITRLQTPIEQYLTTCSFPHGVSQVSLTLSQLCGTAGKQLELRLGQSQQGQRLQDTCQHLMARYGPNRLQQAQVMNMEAPLAEQRFAITPFPTQLL